MTLLLNTYKTITKAGEPVLKRLLYARLKKGKEDAARLDERMGHPTCPRPAGFLVWIHAASVGEAQSALILIETIGKQNSDTKILVTTGTTTSASLMAQRLPPFAFHQFVPLDHPDWVNEFLDHWKPDIALWMESELWPNILMGLKARQVPACLVNARLSDKSFQMWGMFKRTSQEILSTFDIILTQTQKDESRFLKLGGKNVRTTGNLKYSASPLPYDDGALNDLRHAINGRKVWVYASTHDGEEALACRIHHKLKKDIPDILTIIVPRHPNRRGDISKILHDQNIKFTLRGEHKILPTPNDDVYFVDTLGELGLFYKLCDIAMIGRSFSHDGGGGHNPIEAVQMGCAVITGPNNQFQRQLYDDMAEYDAVIEVKDEAELYETVKNLMLSSDQLKMQKEKTRNFMSQKSNIIKGVMDYVSPFMNDRKHKDVA